MKTITLFCLLFVLFLYPFIPIAYAQEFEDRKPALERLEQLNKIKLIAALDLKEEQAVKFFAREKDYRQTERKLIKERIQAAEELELMVKMESKEVDITKKVNDISEVEKKILSTRWDFLNGVKDILNTKQIGQLVLFEQKFQQELRRLLQDVQRQRRENR